MSENAYKVLNRSPMSPPQLWWQRTRTPVLNLSYRFRAALDLPVDLLNRALNRLIQAEPMLRTIFPGGECSQEQVEIEQPHPFAVQYEDLSQLSLREFETAVRQRERSLNASVDLKRWPLLKVAVMRGADGASTLLLIYPSYTGDILSGKQLLKRFLQTCQEIVSGEETLPPASPDRYQDYQDFLDGLDPGVLARYKHYWQTELPANGFAIPVDYERGANSFDSERSCCVEWKLPVEKLKSLKSAPRTTRLYSCLVLALARVTARWSGRERVVLCERVNGRDLPVAKNLFQSLGFYTVDHSFPVDLPAGLSVEAQLREVEHRLADSSLKGAVYNYLNYELTENLFPQHKVTPIRIDFLGRQNSRLAPGIEFEHFRGRFFYDRGEADINYDFINIGREMQEGIKDRDRLFLLDLGPVVQDNTLVLMMYYSVNFHRARTMAWLGGEIIAELEAIVDEAAEAGYRCIV